MVIKVNGEVVSEAAVEFELGRLMRFYSQYMDAAQVRGQMDVLKKKAREQAVGAKLLMMETKKMDFHVSEDVVKKKFDAVVSSAGGVDKFNSMIEKQGLTVQVIMQDISEGSKVEMLIAKVAEGVSDPAEEELEAHFNAHASEYMKPERAQAQHILISAESGNDGTKEAAWKKLDEIRDQIEQGADFSEMAQAHSSCPSGKAAGGSLGWFSRGMMVSEFDKVVFSMENGQVSDIVETQFGFHIIKKIAHEKSEQESYDDVRENIRDFLRHARRGEALSAYVDELKAKAEVEGL